MLISHKHRFIYIAPVRTGTTSIAQVLEQHFEAVIFQEMLFGVDPFPRHDHGLPKQYEDYFVFCSTRNPYTRAISSYNWINRTMIDPVPTSEVMVDPPILRSVCATVFDNVVQNNCVPMRLDAFIKLEYLERDFQQLPFVDRYYAFPRENVSTKIIADLSELEINYVKKHYLRDFEYFGYNLTPYFGNKVLI